VPFDGAPASAIIGLTLFEDLKAQRQLVWNFTPDELPELALMIRLERAARKERLPLFKFAAFGGDRTDKECLRHDANVVAIYGAEGDYDGPRQEDDGWISFAEAVAILKTANIRALVYETATATQETPKWRVLAFASRPYTGSPDELRQLRATWVGRLNSLLCGQLDGISFNLSHAHYYGGIEEKDAPRIVLIPGDPIDLRDDLPLRWKDRRAQPPRPRQYLTAEIPEGLVESGNDPLLLEEAVRRVEISLSRKGAGTQPQGARIYALVQGLADMRTINGVILSAEAIHALIEEACPETTLWHVVSMLGRRQNPRGCELIDAPKVVVDPLPIGVPMIMTRADITRQVDRIGEAFDHGHPRLLARPPCGSGKTTRALASAYLRCAGVDIDAREAYLSGEDNGTTLFVPRQELAAAIEQRMRDALARVRDDDVLVPPKNSVVRLRGRTHGKGDDPPPCLRWKEVEALASKGHSIYRVMCDDGQGRRCPLFAQCIGTTGCYLWQKRHAWDAALVIAMHHNLPDTPPSSTDQYLDEYHTELDQARKAKDRVEEALALGPQPDERDLNMHRPRRPLYYSPHHHRYWIIDEDPTQALMAERLCRRKDFLEHPGLGKLGALIAEGVWTSDGLLTLLQRKDWIAPRLRALVRELREAEKAALAEIDPETVNQAVIKRLPINFPAADIIGRLADEMATGRRGRSYSLQPAKDDKIRAQWRKPVVYRPEQRILILDGTANRQRLRGWFPDLELLA
jgi:hypothetical protein